MLHNSLLLRLKLPLNSLLLLLQNVNIDPFNSRILITNSFASCLTNQSLQRLFLSFSFFLISYLLCVQSYFLFLVLRFNRLFSLVSLFDYLLIMFLVNNIHLLDVGSDSLSIFKRNSKSLFLAFLILFSLCFLFIDCVQTPFVFFTSLTLFYSLEACKVFVL